MRILILLFILITGCTNQNLELQKENMRLKDDVLKIKQQANSLRNNSEVLANQVDSLKTQLYECEMILESYEVTQLNLN